LAFVAKHFGGFIKKEPRSEDSSVLDQVAAEAQENGIGYPGR
jgi:hypothetical protein